MTPHIMAGHCQNMGARDDSDVEAQTLDWVSKVRNVRLESNEDRGEESISILKIPEYYQKLGHFTPVEWRFGLHNRENLCTAESEAIKLSTAAAFGLLGPKWDNFCDDVVVDPVSLLKSYGLHDRLSNFNTTEVKYILLLDALFFVLVFDWLSWERSFTNPALRSLFCSRRVRARLESLQVERDIALLENQIPMALLRNVVENCIHHHANGSDNKSENALSSDRVLDYILKAALECIAPLTDKIKQADGEEQTIIEYLNLAYPEGRLGKCEHILDCIYNMTCGLRGISKESGDYYLQDYIHVESATNLKASGIEIRAVSGTLDDIAFQNGCLCLPVIIMGDLTGPILRNIALYEALYKTPACMFGDYVQLMLDLIGGPNDVKLLTKHGVLVNHLGNDTKVFQVWNDLEEALDIIPSSDAFHEMKAEIVKHCKSKKNVMLAEFKLLFCSRPWYAISALAVSIVTIATCIQTYTAIIGSDHMRPHFPPPH
ncbi:hypothetical protein O6H91_17G088800 [Diphasiastrum complanatum]|uniref:Uncharacterized protein n=1 Tax=Diphasiastrum complanatum TaxID=34168 RepID=A0ACC2B8Z8_DIPCM|nr:hypothetical protein O6H91_17G088800 [Diphasiastrum complanatum]